MFASSPDASTLARSPDASTLWVTALNVGMLQANSFKKSQDEKVAKLAGRVEKWLEEDLAVVGLNEIHPSIAEKLKRALDEKVNVRMFMHETNSLVWRIPQ